MSTPSCLMLQRVDRSTHRCSHDQTTVREYSSFRRLFVFENCAHFALDEGLLCYFQRVVRQDFAVRECTSLLSPDIIEST